MPRPSQKSIILKSALSCFAELTYEGTRLHHIAKRAGVSEGALYKHFPSMEALAQEIFSYHLVKFSESMLEIEQSELAPDEKLRQLVQTYLQTYRDDSDAFYFVLLMKPSFWVEIDPGTVFPLDVAERVIRAGQTAGLVRNGQANLLAAIFLGCILRPIIVARTADPGALDLLHNHDYDQTILESALAAVSKPAKSESH